MSKTNSLYFKWYALFGIFYADTLSWSSWDLQFWKQCIAVIF